MDSLKTLNRQSNPKQKIQVGDTTTADFKTYYKAVVIKTALCWPSNWHKDWCDRMETSEIIHIYTADRFLIKKYSNHTVEQGHSLHQKVGKTGCKYVAEWNYIYTSEWIKVFFGRPEIMKLPKTQRKCIVIKENFLDKTPTARQQKSTWQVGLYHSEASATAKETVNSTVRRCPTAWGKYL